MNCLTKFLFRALMLFLAPFVSATVTHALNIELTQVSPVTFNTYHLLESSTWTEAEAAAQSLGGHLETINDAAEEDWVWTTFNPNGTSLIWIGMNDIAVEGVLVWSSGEPVTYTNWATDQPTSQTNPLAAGDTEDYIQMGYGSVPYPKHWNDLSNYSTWAGSPLHGVVEVPGVPEPSSIVMVIIGLVSLTSVSTYRRFRRSWYS